MKLLVLRSKTGAGTGRVVPFTRRACAALTLWLSRFPDAQPDSYVFPFHHVGFAGNKRRAHLWGIDLDRPMSHYSYKTAWNTARENAKLDYRFTTRAIRSLPALPRTRSFPRKRFGSSLAM